MSEGKLGAGSTAAVTCPHFGNSPQETDCLDRVVRQDSDQLWQSVALTKALSGCLSNQPEGVRYELLAVETVPAKSLGDDGPPDGRAYPNGCASKLANGTELGTVYENCPREAQSRRAGR